MSRIGNRLLTLKEGMVINVTGDNLVTITGSKGTLTKQLPTIIKIVVEGQTIKTIRNNEKKHTKQLHGTTNSLLQGMIIGVSEAFTKTLLIVGVGYRANMDGNKLILSLGFSHLINIVIPDGIKVEVVKQTKIIILGIDKQLVGQFAAEIRAFRKPEPYKGKGIKYEDEIIKRKEGKSAGK